MKKIVHPKHPYGCAGAEFTVTCMSIKPSGYKVSLSTSNNEWDVHVPLEPKQNNILKAIGVVYKK